MDTNEQELRAQQMVLEAFEARLLGAKDYTLEEAMEYISKMISSSSSK